MYFFNRSVLNRISTLIILVAISVGAYGVRYRQKPETKHHFGVQGGAGYSMLLNDYEEIQTIGSVCGAVGLDYELRVGGFWLAPGLELQYLSGSSLFLVPGTDVQVLDTRGFPVTYHYSFDRGVDVQSFLFANLAVVMGYYCRGFYFGAGAKIGYSILSHENTTLSYTTSGTYDQYIDDFSQMNNHYYTSYKSTTDAATKNRYKLSAVAEIGYDVLSAHRSRYRTITSGLKIAAYAEYGINNLGGASSDASLYDIDSQNPSTLHLQPFYYSRAGVGHRIHPICAGVKISWLFCIRSSNCNCFETWRRSR